MASSNLRQIVWEVVPRDIFESPKDSVSARAWPTCDESSTGTCSVVSSTFHHGTMPGSPEGTSSIVPPVRCVPPQVSTIHFVDLPLRLNPAKKRMLSPSPIGRDVVTTAAPAWRQWRLSLFLLLTVSHATARRPRWTINVCHRTEMPTVVLAKEKKTGKFALLKRYAPTERVPPLDEWTWDPNVRDLLRSDYDSILSSSSAKGQPGGLRSRQLNDQYPGLQLPGPQSQSSSSSPNELDRRGNRFLETYPSSNDTLSEILEDFDLFYAR